MALDLFAAFGIGILFVLLIIAAAILGLIFWILMIIDAAKRQFTGSNDKVVWILVIVILGHFGALIYYFVIKRKTGESILKFPQC